MISDLSVALVGCSEFEVELEEQLTRIYQVSSLKDLVRLLIDTQIDVIIYNKSSYQIKSCKKIFSKYNIPGIIVQEDIVNEEHLLTSHAEDKVCETLSANRKLIMASRIQRENKKMVNRLEKLTNFTNQVIHSTQEMFITETKKFFNETFKMDHCHWVETRELSSKLPPILKLRNELAKQKVNLSSVIAELDSCTVEVAQDEEFQIWKTQQGHYMALIWVAGPEGMKQCIVFNRVQIENLTEMKDFLSALLPFLKRRWALCIKVEHAQKQIYRDSLTNLYNQKFLTEVLEKKIEEYRRYKTPFSVLFIDVDHFKKVNDSLGHLVGSGVLTRMGDILEGQIRNSDYAFRYGGDEFIVLLSHTAGDDAVNVAERIRKKVENHEFNVNNEAVNITVSIGLAFYPTHAQSAEEVVRIADEAMYYGKNKSRNIVYKAS